MTGRRRRARAGHEFSVWAPDATEVALVLAGGDVPMDKGSGGWWRTKTHAPDGTTYEFRLDGGDPRPDPRAVRMPQGPHGPSAVFDLEAHRWHDRRWTGVELEGCVIYEVHVGTFTPEGTLDAAIGRLDYLVELGVDMVQLMPLASFPGVDGWGYDGVNLYAVHEPYGGPAALQRFVDAAHRRGLAVCLDVVYNHLGPDGNFLAEFGPYFTDKYETPWGMGLNLDAPWSDEVRDFVLGNVRQWVVDFHLDALRLDAVHELHDDRALPLLERMSIEVDTIAAQQDRRIWLIAETDRNDPLTVTPRTRSEGPGTGLGIHAQWADDVHHGLHVALTGETQGYYADFAAPGALSKVLRTPFFHDGLWSSFRLRTHGRPVDSSITPGFRFVASLQTHDQVGNRMAGDRISSLAPAGLVACGAALLLTSAYTPMLFMGEEWGASTPWLYFTDHTDEALSEAVREGRRNEFADHGWDREDVPDPEDPATVERSRLRWDERLEQPHARMLSWYRALLAIRKARADLRDPALDEVKVDHDAESGLVVVQRGDYHVVANLGDADLQVLLALPPLSPRVVLLAYEPLCRLDSDGALFIPARSAAVVGPSTAG